VLSGRVAAAGSPRWSATGRLRLLGCDPGGYGPRREIRRRLGYLPRNLGYYPAFTVVEFVEYFARLKEMAPARIPAAVAGPETAMLQVVVDPLVVSQFAAGDEDAVRTVYRAYGRLVFAVAYRVLGDRGLAEEATQQAFLQAWRASASFEPSKELGPWLATIARRAAIDIHRREARHAHRALEDADPADPGLVSLPPSVDRIYDVWQVRQALSELSPDEASLVRLQHMEGLTHNQIAQRLNIPVGTVKSRSFRAHRRLAGLLGHLRGDDPADTAAPRPPRIGTGGKR
jgi:RNA polymerase sigma factor (sigma-70 family)